MALNATLVAVAWCVVVVVWCVVVRRVVKCWEGWVDNFDLVYCREREPCKRAAESHQEDYGTGSWDTGATIRTES